MPIKSYEQTVDFVDQETASISYTVTYLDCDGTEKTITGTVDFVAPNPPNLVPKFDGSNLLVSDWTIDATGQSVKIAGSATLQPDLGDVDAKDPLNGATGTTAPLIDAAATPGSVGFVSGVAFSGLNGTGRESALATAQTTLPGNGPGGGGGDGTGDALVDVCYREFLFNGADDYFGFVVPSAMTDLATISGVSNTWHSKKIIGDKMSVRLQTFVIASAPGRFALQYYDGASWRYMDGINGPFVEFASTGLHVSTNFVPVEAAAAGDRELRLVVSDGDDATNGIWAMVLIEWCAIADNAPPDSGTGDSSGDCSVVETDGIEYANRAAMEAAGWFLTPDSAIPWYSAAWALVTTSPHGGTYALRGAIARNAGATAGEFVAKKTYTGLAANTWHTVSVWAKQAGAGEGSSLPSWDNYTQLWAGGQKSPDRLTSPDTWQQLVVSALSDAAGNLEVILRREVPTLSMATYFVFYYDDLKVQVGQNCDPSSGCTVVGSSHLDYADITAMEADGWTVTEAGDSTADIDTSTGHTPYTKSFLIWHNGGGSAGTNAVKTFGGFTPGAAVTVKCWMKFTKQYWFDASSIIHLSSGEEVALSGADPSNTWVQKVVHGTANGSGEISITLKRNGGYPIGYNVKTWYSDLRAFEGASC